MQVGCFLLPTEFSPFARVCDQIKTTDHLLKGTKPLISWTNSLMIDFLCLINVLDYTFNKFGLDF